MTETFHKLLLNELHMVVIQPGNQAGLSDRLLCEAVTVNENLRSLGYVLKPADLIRLAVSPDLHSFYDAVRKLVPSVKAEPMYPGFPQQVMEMSEAEFRFHQAIHYFSTYGLELLTGTQVSRGWLPAYDSPARTQTDTPLMEAKVLEPVYAQEAAVTALGRLLARRERLTNPELELVLESVRLCAPEQLEGLTVRFKENLELLFPLLAELPDRAAALSILRSICPHTGDVLRCTADYLRRRKYRLRTSEKKLLVRLLERYPVRNLEQNLMQSLHMRERNLTVLQHLDFNRYSRSPEHAEAVRALRNGELKSWHGIAEHLLADRSAEALLHLAQRPGYMVRMLNRLLSLGYSRQQLLDALLPRADAVSGHLVLKTLRTLTGRENRIREEHRLASELCRQTYVQARAELEPAALRRERNRLIASMQQSARYRCIGIHDADWEYRLLVLRARAATRIQPAQIALCAKQAQLQTLRDSLEQSDRLRREKGSVLIRNAHSDFDPVLVRAIFLPGSFRRKIADTEAELAALHERLEQARQEAEAWLAQQLRCIDAGYARIAEDLARIDPQELEQLSVLVQECDEKLEQRASLLSDLFTREREEQAALDQQLQSQLQLIRHDQDAVSILKELLQAHYRGATTPLKSKKVFCRLEQFDLNHSVLETEDRSQNGGYIRSGISYRIPEGARFVRFFVYWNDPNRVDIDLHAGGVTAEGEALHVGWNADFRSCGVVHSGDITHSDAAEYIDIDLSAPLQEIYANVHLFSGKRGFRHIESCYVGMMAVDRIGADVKHYDPANCFFTHQLTQDITRLYYGYVDVRNRFVRFVGQPNPRSWHDRPRIESDEGRFSLGAFLRCVLEAQGAEPVTSEDQADVVLTMGKSQSDKGISLVDHNFFLEC